MFNFDLGRKEFNIKHQIFFSDSLKALLEKEISVIRMCAVALHVESSIRQLVFGVGLVVGRRRVSPLSRMPGPATSATRFSDVEVRDGRVYFVEADQDEFEERGSFGFYQQPHQEGDMKGNVFIMCYFFQTIVPQNLKQPG